MKTVPGSPLAWLPVLVVLATPPAALAEPAPSLSLQTILQRHAAAVGIRSVPPPRSGRIRGTLERGRERGTWTSTFRAPDREYDESVMDGQTSSSGFDGKVAWQRDANGNVRRDTPEELKGQNSDPEAALRAGAAAHITLRPETERRTGAYVLDLLPEGGRPLVVSIDLKTFLISRVSEQRDDETVVTTFQQWQAQDGLVRPVRWTVSNGDKKYDETVTVAGVEYGVDAPDALFAEPTPVKNYRFLKPGATSATVPFDYDGDKISLSVEINGVPAHVALDSGAGGVVLSQPLVDALKIKQRGAFEGRGIGGSLRQSTVTLDSFGITDAVQFSHLSAATGIGIFGHLDHPLFGLVGYDLLSRFVVKVDYAGGQVTLTEPDAFHPEPDDGTPLPLQLDGNTPSVEASFDGLPAARFLIDTGDPDTLQLSLPYVQANALGARYPKGKGRDVTEGGVGGQAEYDVFHAKSLQLAGVRLAGIPVYLPRDSKGGWSRQIAGILGTEVLSRFTVTFDYPHGRLFLAPGPTAADPFDTRSFGVGVLPDVGKDGRLHVYVDHIDAAAPALKNGLKIMDEVLSVDGQSVSLLGFSEVRQLLTVGSERPDHDLLVKGPRGKEHTCRVSLYDLVPSAP